MDRKDRPCHLRGPVGPVFEKLQKKSIIPRKIAEMLVTTNKVDWDQRKKYLVTGMPRIPVSEYVHDTYLGYGVLHSTQLTKVSSSKLKISREAVSVDGTNSDI